MGTMPVNALLVKDLFIVNGNKAYYSRYMEYQNVEVPLYELFSIGAPWIAQNTVSYCHLEPSKFKENRFCQDFDRLQCQTIDSL